MIIKAGQFLKLSANEILEVIYADDEKAVCLMLNKSHCVGWTYTGQCVALSNRTADYPGRRLSKEIKVVPGVELSGKCKWPPLKPVITFPSVKPDGHTLQQDTYIQNS